MQNKYKKNQRTILFLSYFSFFICLTTQTNYCARALLNPQKARISKIRKLSLVERLINLEATDGINHPPFPLPLSSNSLSPNNAFNRKQARLRLRDIDRIAAFDQPYPSNTLQAKQKAQLLIELKLRKQN